MRIYTYGKVFAFFGRKNVNMMEDCQLLTVMGIYIVVTRTNIKNHVVVFSSEGEILEIINFVNGQNF